MALQTSLTIRFTIAGDDESTSLVLDLRETPVQLGKESYYGFVPVTPDSIICARMDGPGMSKEHRDLPSETVKLYGSYLVLLFEQPLMRHEDHYTVEIVFGFNGAALPDLTE